jgi:hypothetical protein
VKFYYVNKYLNSNLYTLAMDQEIIEFLQECNIPIDVENQLEGQLLPRDILLSTEIYEKVKPYIGDVLKKKFSSSRLTSLHKDADKEQKWPLLNLVRQVLRICNYQMKPVRRSAGYYKDGKKKYLRYFLINKYKSVVNPVTPPSIE